MRARFVSIRIETLEADLRPNAVTVVDRAGIDTGTRHRGGDRIRREIVGRAPARLPP
jgi:hypothetical protein